MAVNIHAILGRDHGVHHQLHSAVVLVQPGIWWEMESPKAGNMFFNVKNLQELTISYLTRFVNHPKYDEYRFTQISPKKGMTVFSRHGYGIGDCKLERVLCSYIGYIERCPSPWPHPTVMLHHHHFQHPLSASIGPFTSPLPPLYPHPKSPHPKMVGSSQRPQKNPTPPAPSGRYSFFAGIRRPVPRIVSGTMGTFARFAMDTGPRLNFLGARGAEIGPGSWR